MFNFEREFPTESKLIASQAAKETVEQQQRDVYESHRHRTFSLAFYMTGNELEAEQILATTFVRVFQQSQLPDGFEVDRALVGELSQRFALRQEAPAITIAPGTNMGQRNVLRPELEAAVGDLPPNERLLFLLRDVEGYKPALIARLLDIPEAQVHRACFSARLRLRQILAAKTVPHSSAA